MCQCNHIRVLQKFDTGPFYLLTHLYFVCSTFWHVYRLTKFRQTLTQKAGFWLHETVVMECCTVDNNVMVEISAFFSLATTPLSHTHRLCRRLHGVVGSCIFAASLSSLPFLHPSPNSFFFARHNFLTMRLLASPTTALRTYDKLT